jgi:hypothetical protein
VYGVVWKGFSVPSRGGGFRKSWKSFSGSWAESFAYDALILSQIFTFIKREKQNECQKSIKIFLSRSYRKVAEEKKASMEGKGRRMEMHNGFSPYAGSCAERKTSEDLKVRGGRKLKVGGKFVICTFLFIQIFLRHKK